jgi:DNA-binding PadR family transcriptional regulator
MLNDDTREPARAGSEDSRFEQGTSETTGARKSMMYQLFILGQLLDRSMHGYKLRDILSNTLGPFRHISWGYIYPLVRQLEGDGAIESSRDTSAETEPHGASASTRQRKGYRITPIGRERFLALMREPEEYSVDTPDLFLVKLLYFGHIPREEQFAILQRYHGYLQTVNAYLQSGYRRNASNQAFSEHERLAILETISYRMSSVEGELLWVERKITRITTEAVQGPVSPHRPRTDTV